jgi:hypothetical protein
LDEEFFQRLKHLLSTHEIRRINWWKVLYLVL